MHNILSNLFREIESDIGTNEFFMLAVESLDESILQYKFKGKKEFIHHLESILGLLKTTKPKYAILIDAFCKILKFAKGADETNFIETLSKEIANISAGYQIDRLKMIQVAQEIKTNNKNILIYGHSHSVHSILKKMKDDGRKISIIVAEQDLGKTADNIAFLHKENIDYKVVPAYMISHIEESIDMIFFGAVTMQSDGNFVMDPGSKSIISELYLEKKPVYVFLTTSKFSLWSTSESSKSVYAKPHKRRHHALTHIEYERLKFSHDRIPTDLFTSIITEYGVLSPKETKDLFDRLLLKRGK